jgi:hypothetical protein
LNATSFIGVPEYSRLFKGSSPTAIAGARTRSAPGGVVATSKESIVRSYCARLRAAAWPAALPCALGGVPNPGLTLALHVGKKGIAKSRHKKRR